MTNTKHSTAHHVCPGQTSIIFGWFFWDFENTKLIYVFSTNTCTIHFRRLLNIKCLLCVAFSEFLLMREREKADRYWFTGPIWTSSSAHLGTTAGHSRTCVSISALPHTSQVVGIRILIHKSQFLIWESQVMIHPYSHHGKWILQIPR